MKKLTIQEEHWKRFERSNLILLLISVILCIGAFALVEQGVTRLVVIPSFIVAVVASIRLSNYKEPKE